MISSRMITAPTTAVLLRRNRRQISRRRVMRFSPGPGSIGVELVAVDLDGDLGTVIRHERSLSVIEVS